MSQAALHPLPVFEAYELLAEGYDEANNPMLELESRVVGALLAPGGDTRSLQGCSVCELGCGTGRWLQWLAQRKVGTLVGVDQSPSMLQCAARKLGSRAQLIRDGFASRQVGCASYDLVIVSFVVGYVADLGMLSAQIARITKPNAKVVISDIHPETYRKRKWKRSFSLFGRTIEVKSRTWSLDCMIDVIERSGMAVEVVLEPTFGCCELAMLAGAGKDIRAEEWSTDPAIYVVQARKCRGPYAA
jgi:ubiquinone/menaquinone biosynthesis C-methylase UbiE